MGVVADISERRASLINEISIVKCLAMMPSREAMVPFKALQVASPLSRSRTLPKPLVEHPPNFIPDSASTRLQHFRLMLFVSRCLLTALWVACIVYPDRILANGVGMEHLDLEVVGRQGF